MYKRQDSEHQPGQGIENSFDGKFGGPPYHSIWNQKASIAASEASSEGLRATFSPMIDVSRDPRWGRMMESFGEDPYVNGIMGKAMVDGYQQKDDAGIAACLKHFAGYGAVNAGREYNDVEISKRTFLEQYVKPFRMALKAKRCV